MKTFLLYAGIAIISCMVMRPYYSLHNLSYLSKLEDISDAIKDCTKEIHELVKAVDKLRKEVKDFNEENENGKII